MTIKANQDQDKKRIAVFLDGTWNEVTDNTNVWRLKSLCGRTSNDGRRQIQYYDEGVNGFWGGTFGKGLIENIIQAYEWLVENYEDGDELFIFGFSRGAFTARSLAGFVAKYGLLKSGSPLGVGQLYERYKRANDQTIWELVAAQRESKLGLLSVEESWMLKYSMPVNIKMVGVWDTVGSHGIPLLNIPGISRSGFLHTGLRLPIENGFHALAIDEHRRAFVPTLWTTKTSTLAAPRPVANVEQRWFVGTHGNVGGGYHSNVLALRPMQWMVKKAESLGLSFREEIVLDDGMFAAAIPDSYREFLDGWYCRISRRWHREIGVTDVIADGSPSKVINETIDSSVFERWRRDKAYRPTSLDKWIKAKNIDIEGLSSSVSADDSSIRLLD